jgi:hypothetical protein
MHRCAPLSCDIRALSPFAASWRPASNAPNGPSEAPDRCSSCHAYSLHHPKRLHPNPAPASRGEPALSKFPAFSAVSAGARLRPAAACSSTRRRRPLEVAQTCLRVASRSNPLSPQSESVFEGVDYGLIVPVLERISAGTHANDLCRRTRVGFEAHSSQKHSHLRCEQCSVVGRTRGRELSKRNTFSSKFELASR